MAQNSPYIYRLRVTRGLGTVFIKRATSAAFHLKKAAI
jgi:hypothetical protein